jgi:hypothetical protein
VHAVISKEYKDKGFERENELILRQALGKPKVNSLEKGLSVIFNSHWLQYKAERWPDKLYQSKNLPSIDKIIDNEEAYSESPLIINCASGLLAEFLIYIWGKEEFLSEYNLWEPDKNELDLLNIKWLQFLRNNYGQNISGLPYGKNPTSIPHFIKGFNFAHEGYQVYNGYLGATAQINLQQLKNLGTNAVSIIPYSGFNLMDTAHSFSFMKSAGAENDAAVIYSAYVAKQLGLHVMMKPQLWSWRGWTGDIKMSDENEWNKFFDNNALYIKTSIIVTDINGNNEIRILPNSI